jgi:hypothetical protein
MKTTIATLFLALTAGQVNAGGFYQQVNANWQQSNTDDNQHISESVSEATSTPLYSQVVGKSREEFNHGKVVIRTSSKTTHTPLYQTVVGNPQESIVHRIADENNGKVNTES